MEKKQLILIVDDLKNNRLFLRKIATSMNCNVEEAANGKEGLEMARLHKPDMIISDVLMPVMDGFMFCKEVNRDDKLKNIPFIFYTATYSDKKDEAFALSIGAYKYIVKPSEPEVLQNLMKNFDKKRKTAAFDMPKKVMTDEKDVFKLYSERLVNKLENKMLDLEQEIIKRKQTEETLKESKEKLRMMIDNSPIGVSITDINGCFTDANFVYCKLLGYTKKELIGKHFNDFTHPDDRERNIKIYTELVQQKISSFDLEKRYINKDGEVIYVFIRSQLICDKNRKPLFEIVISEDITKQKKAEEQIKQDLREKNALIQEIYHRTKNNMAVVSAMLSMKSRRSTNDYVKTAFREINNKIQAMSLVHQNLYKANDFSNISLNDYIENLAKLIKQSYGILTKNIEFEFEMQEVNILIDSALPLGLIITELVTNTIKHAFPKNQEGKISIKLFKEKDETINFEMIDNGVGFPQNFDPRKNGSMGFTSIFTIVEKQLKGEISVKSENGLRWHIKIKDDKYKERI